MRDRDQICDTHADQRRFWCDYRRLEEYHAGMWRTVASEQEQVRLIAESVALLRSRRRFRAASMRVVREWPVSTKTELTAPGYHRAWLGQASCCIESGVPESLTRRAWWKLSDEERIEADNVADWTVAMWKDEHGELTANRQLSLFGAPTGSTSGQFFCDYRDLEEWKAGMWKHVAGDDERAEWLNKAVVILRDSDAFRAAMRDALERWPTSCLFNFTNQSLNKPVWLAHAGACLVRGIPEEFMRLGYWELTQEEKDRADKDAIEVAAEWRDPRAQTVS